MCLRERETVWGRLLLRGCERVNTYEDVARERERERVKRLSLKEAERV